MRGLDGEEGERGAGVEEGGGEEPEGCLRGGSKFEIGRLKEFLLFFGDKEDEGEEASAPKNCKKVCEVSLFFLNFDFDGARERGEMGVCCNWSNSLVSRSSNNPISPFSRDCNNSSLFSSMEDEERVCEGREGEGVRDRISWVFPISGSSVSKTSNKPMAPFSRDSKTIFLLFSLKEGEEGVSEGGGKEG